MSNTLGAAILLGTLLSNGKARFGVANENAYDFGLRIQPTRRSEVLQTCQNNA